MKKPITLGRLEEITDIRTIWQHEEYDFSQWLSQEDNLQQLSSTLGIDIIDPQTEVRSGSFEIDILATEGQTNNTIIIENQLENSNHEHLGKIITYASGKDAKYVIWIVKKAREEHRSAIDWLNSITNEQIHFFLIEIKVYRIGESEPAPKFEVISQPNDWGKIVKNVSNKDELNNSQLLRIEFWSEYLNSINRTDRKPTKDHWMGFYGYGSGCYLSLVTSTLEKVSCIDLIIKDKSKYEQLVTNGSKISEKFENYNFWGFDKEEAKSGGLRVKSNYDYRKKDDWPKIFEWFEINKKNLAEIIKLIK
jgi:Domain of unknown function (DUF4268)